MFHPQHSSHFKENKTTISQDTIAFLEASGFPAHQPRLHINIYIYTHKFIEVLTGPAPLFYLKHIPNRSLAFSDISPVEPVWTSRLLLDPALNLSNKRKNKDTTVFAILKLTELFQLIFHSPTKVKNLAQCKTPNAKHVLLSQIHQNGEIQELQRDWDH